MATRTKGPLIAEAIHALHGANYFSWDPVVVLRLNLAAYDEVFSNTIPGFNSRLKERLPSLIEHKCSEGVRGGFFFRLDQGTLLGHVTEHVALELQALAGIDVAFGKTRSTSRPGVYNVVFRFEDEPVGIRAAEAAYDFVNCCLTGDPYDVTEVVEELAAMHKSSMGPWARALLAVARRREIPCYSTPDGTAIGLGTGPYWRRIGTFDQPPHPDRSGSGLEAVAGDCVDRWFPPGAPTHVPLFAVAAAHGASIARDLIVKALALNGQSVVARVASDRATVQDTLSSPDLDAVLFEVPLHTILHRGLPYGRADTGIILNAAGLQPVTPDLTDPDDLAYALAVTVEEVHNAGVAVLNADDPHVLEMARRVYARPVFFTRDRNLRFLSEHITAGNLAVVLNGDLITIEQRREVREVGLLSEWDDLPAPSLSPDQQSCEPLTHQQGAVDAILGTVAALAGNGWTPYDIRRAIWPRSP
jgi:cyanophycin synthetase